MFLCLIAVGVVSGTIDFGCPPEGIIAIKYPGSCQRFVHCIFGTGMIRECAPGLQFNVVTGQCAVPEQANCNPCRDNPANSVTFTRSPFNCTRFSMCIGTVLSENQCAEGFRFDTRSNTCSLKQNVICEDVDDGTTPEPPGDDDEVDPGTDGACDRDLNCKVHHCWQIVMTFG